MNALMIQGTSSHAGKSIITAGILRILKRRGISCAPFKPQNMALNSFVTMDGYEIGRAQAMQAESAKILPTVHMNPILLKPTSDSKAQVVLLGKPYKNLNAREYLEEKKILRKYAIESFNYLKKSFDVVVIEGAGSPAEINLRKNDIANMGFAKIFDIPVVIVGDIDRGGVYASFYGTYALLNRSERRLIKGFLINKFRGDSSLLQSANEYITKKTNVPVIGVVPFFKDIKISEEDGVALTNPGGGKKDKAVNIGVIKLPRISNFTDFEPFLLEEDVNLIYLNSPSEGLNCDLIIIPGSKNTIEDLIYLRNSGFEAFLKSFVKKGGELIGICGGYQMLGRKIYDPYGIESNIKEAEGLGYLAMETTMEKEKRLEQVTFETIDGKLKDMKGYEIHMGISKVFDGERVFRIKGKEEFEDGVKSKKANVWGSYIHGLFDNDSFRLHVLNGLREIKGLPVKKRTYNYLRYKDDAYEKLADTIENSVNMDYLLKIIGIG
ncbi:MAG: cobyric acid synthase [Proteobacteria bacterium]|nr:cobyric acid synthase [Pseudomonadota bacterium]